MTDVIGPIHIEPFFIITKPYGDGHLVSKAQAIELLSEQTYLPETGKAYEWIAYRSEDFDYLLWLKDEEGNTSIVRMVEADAVDKVLEVVPGQNGIGELDNDGAPKEIEGYTRLNKILVATDENLTDIKFGDPENTIQVRSPSEAAELVPKFEYNEETDTSSSFVVISEFNQSLVGFCVDAVDKINRLSWSQVEPPAGVISSDGGILTAIVKFDDRMVLLLDFEKITADIIPDSGMQVESENCADEKVHGVDRSSITVLVVED